VEKAAVAAGCSKRTLLRWCKWPVFAQALEEARRQTVDDALNKLRTSLTAAVDKLTDLMNGATTEAISLRAAVALLDHGTRAVETYDVLARLTALEILLKGRAP
jgi:hypothetical protein